MIKKLIGPLVCLASLLGTLMLIHIVLPQEGGDPGEALCNGQPEPSGVPNCATQQGCAHKVACSRDNGGMLLHLSRLKGKCCINEGGNVCRQVEGYWACCRFTNETKWV